MVSCETVPGRFGIVAKARFNDRRLQSVTNPRQQNSEDRLMTAAAAAAFLGYSEGTVRNKASAGELPKVKLGTALRFRRSDLERWIAERDAEGKLMLEQQREARGAVA